MDNTQKYQDEFYDNLYALFSQLSEYTSDAHNFSVTKVAIIKLLESYIKSSHSETDILKPKLVALKQQIDYDSTNNLSTNKIIINISRDIIYLKKYRSKNVNSKRNLFNLFITNKPFPIKDGLAFIFNQNPLLAKIGTKEQYTIYLDTIFPNSKIKEILYHGSPKHNITRFLTPQDLEYKKHENTTTGNAGIYFADSITEAERYTKWNSGENGRIYPVIVNVEKFITVGENILDGLTDEGMSKSLLWNIQPSMLNSLKSANIDALIAGAYMIKTEGFKEVAMLNSSKIHILGSKLDIEGFRKFVSQHKNL